MSTIRTIMPKNTPEAPLLRVAAYCRVSSNSDDQIHSFGVQTEYYKQLIGGNPLWTLADIYADEGITGTGMRKRDEFNRMIADCKHGKIDRILTKSVSRFARNTVDCLETVRMLSGIGISILFEKEQIDTAKMSSEVVLGMLSTQAQDESVSISGNMRWSYEKRMRNGDFSGCRHPYGYRLVHGKLIIDETEAEIIKTIFQMFLSGKSIRAIVSSLNENGVPRNGREEKWSRTTIRYILSNERYIGDALLQKYYTTDTIPHRVVKNCGERRQFYVENNHTAIISRADFDNAQKLLEAKRHAYVCTKHDLTGLLRCPTCGNTLRIIQSRNSWRCSGCNSEQRNQPAVEVKTDDIRFAVIRIINVLRENREHLLKPAINRLEKLHCRINASERKLYEIDTEISTVSKQIYTLSRLQTQGILDAADFAEQNRSLSTRLSQLRASRLTLLQGGKGDDVLDKLRELDETLASLNDRIQTYDEALARKVICKIIPHPTREIEMCLFGGLVLTERLPSVKRRCRRQ